MKSRLSNALCLAAFSMALCLFYVDFAFAQFSIPHVFNSGETAKAADVNANFQALADAINAANSTPIPNDGTYSALQYSTSNTLAGRNVVVMSGVDDVNSVTRFSVRTSYMNATVAGAMYTYVREFAFINVDGAGTATGISLRMGTNALVTAAGQNEAWVTEVYSWADGSPLMVSNLVTATRTDEYLCYNAAVSGQVHHCRHLLRDTPVTNAVSLTDESRIQTLVGAFSVGSLNFTSGVAGSFFGARTDRDYFLVARNVGMVIETRRFGVVPAGFRADNPNVVTHAVIYYRINGTPQGTLGTSLWASGGKGYGLFFTP